MLQRLSRTLSALLLTAGILSILFGCAESLLLGHKEQAAVAPVQMFYTVDDGKTHFADDATKIAPFDKDGKPASRVYMFTCDERKTQFVAYMERLTPEAKKKSEQAVKQGIDQNAMADLDLIYMEGTEVKKPGDAKWVKRNSADGEKIINVTCPDGKTENLNIVMPGD